MKPLMLNTVCGYVLLLTVTVVVCHGARSIYQGYRRPGRWPVKFSKVCECHYHAQPIPGQRTVVAEMQKRIEQMNRKLDKLNLNIKALAQPKVVPVTAASCKDILHKSRSRNVRLGDGVYTILVGAQKMKVYCDMTRNGGGWTLITATTTSYGWTKTSVYGRNVGNPSLNHDYSILGQADSIKSHTRGNTFQYRIEVNGRGRWGGIWTAPASYSFTSTDGGQTSVNLVKKFDAWKYNNDGIQKRMPWIDLNHCCALLTTHRQTQSNWWGTLIMHSKTTGDHHRKLFNVAPWITGQVIKGNKLYYWLREN